MKKYLYGSFLLSKTLLWKATTTELENAKKVLQRDMEKVILLEEQLNSEENKILEVFIPQTTQTFIIARIMFMFNITERG